MTENEIAFDVIDEIAAGYRAAQVLLAANRLGLFSVLGEKALTAEEIASSIGADQRGTRILCDALVALSILEKSKMRYRNSAAALEYLIPSSPRSRCASLRHAAVLYERWGGLVDAVRSGRRVDDARLDPSLRESSRTFASAMADIGRVSAVQTADRLDLRGAKLLLDVGGGPGIYALEFARRYPGLHVVLLDDAETLEAARENFHAQDAAGRVSLRPGNAFEDELGTGYDCIFLSNLVHIYSFDENQRLIGRCAEALRPGGRIAVKDFLLDDKRTSPPGAALFAVNMLVSTDGGDCYTVADMGHWFTSAGLRLEQVIALTAQSGLVVARKPDHELHESPEGS